MPQYFLKTIDTSTVGVSITPGYQMDRTSAKPHVKLVNYDGSNGTAATPLVVTDHSLDNATDTGTRVTRPGTGTGA